MIATLNKEWGTIVTTLSKPGEKCSSAGITNPLPSTFGLLDSETEFPGDQSDNPEFLRLPGVDFTFSKTFDIPAVSRSYSTQGEIEVIKVSWPAVTPSAPPRDTPDSGK